MTMLPKISALLLLLFALTACGTLSKDPAAEAIDVGELGKVHIRYYYTEADASNPPVAFNVMRSSSAAGPFTRINDKPLTAVEAPKRGQMQQLMTDVGLPLGERFWYYIERVDKEGSRTKATSTAAATVTLPLQPEDQSAVREIAREGAEKRRAGQKTPNQPKLPATGHNNG